MNKLSYFVVIGTSALAACGSKTDANERNFSAAMSAYLEKQGDVCLGLKEWPYVIEENQMNIKFGNLPRLNALAKAGVVTVSETFREDKGFDGKVFRRVPAKQFQIADSAKKYTKSTEASTFDGGKKTYTDLCFAKLKLDKVTKWEGPMAFGEYKEAKVYYTTKLENVAPWAEQPDIKAAFPIVERTMSKSDPRTHGLKLTSEGWEAKGLDGGLF